MCQLDNIVLLFLHLVLFLNQWKQQGQNVLHLLVASELTFGLHLILAEWTFLLAIKESSLGINWVLTISVSNALDTPCRRSAGNASRLQGWQSCSCRSCSRSCLRWMRRCWSWGGWGRSRVIRLLEGSVQSCIRSHRGAHHRFHLYDRLVHHTCLESDWLGSLSWPVSTHSFAVARIAWSSLAGFAWRRNPFLSESVEFSTMCNFELLI